MTKYEKHRSAPSVYTLRPKIFAPFDFYSTHLTIRLIQKICANVKTIMIYLYMTIKHVIAKK
jgi:hypothetical protein